MNEQSISLVLNLFDKAFEYYEKENNKIIDLGQKTNNPMEISFLYQQLIILKDDVSKLKDAYLDFNRNVVLPKLGKL